MNSFNFIVSSTSTCGEKSEIKIKKYFSKIFRINTVYFIVTNFNNCFLTLNYSKI
ncbi:hypothetical protein [Spiroplasma ixodetis]|uniref:hypothetical protein n=1 Tax=Spiroplasma ixodetis TaxID=2141 RepID=UPI002577B2C4|nr:hypothetical protein [Spiroplasma ixodetis]